MSVAEEHTREVTVYWCPICNFQTSREWHSLRDGGLFPQLDTEHKCEKYVLALPAPDRSGDRINLDEVRAAAEDAASVRGAEVLALVEAVEAARGVLEFARTVDLQAAVVQGGFPDLGEALARFDFGGGA